MIPSKLLKKQHHMGQINESLQKHLMDWVKINEQKEIPEDTWTVLPVLPKIAFKNLRMVSTDSDLEKTNDSHEITITVKYDEFKTTDHDERI